MNAGVVSYGELRASSVGFCGGALSRFRGGTTRGASEPGAGHSSVQPPGQCFLLGHSTARCNKCPSYCGRLPEERAELHLKRRSFKLFQCMSCI